jgi:hypothetical protein
MEQRHRAPLVVVGSLRYDAAARQGNASSGTHAAAGSRWRCSCPGPDERRGARAGRAAAVRRAGALRLEVATGPLLARELTAVNNTGWTVFVLMNLQIVAAQVQSNSYKWTPGVDGISFTVHPLVVISLPDHARGLGPCLAKHGGCCILACARVSLAPASGGPPSDSLPPRVSRCASKSPSPRTRSGAPRAPSDAERNGWFIPRRRCSWTRRTPGVREGRARRCSSTPRTRSTSQLHVAS